jgi:hypothetical protein
VSALLKKDLWLCLSILILLLPALWAGALVFKLDILLSLGGTMVALICLPGLIAAELPRACPVAALPVRGKDLPAARYAALLAIWLLASLPGLAFALLGQNPLSGQPFGPEGLMIGLAAFFALGAVMLFLSYRHPDRLLLHFFLAVIALTLGASGSAGIAFAGGAASPAAGPRLDDGGRLALAGTCLVLAAFWLGSLALSRRVAGRTRTGDADKPGRAGDAEWRMSFAPSGDAGRVALLLGIQFRQNRGIWIGMVVFGAFMTFVGLLPGTEGQRSIYGVWWAWFVAAELIIMSDSMGGIAMDWRNWLNNQTGDTQSPLLALPLSRGAYLGWKLAGPWCLLLACLVAALFLQGAVWLVLAGFGKAGAYAFPGLRGIPYLLLAWGACSALYLLGNAASGFRLRAGVLLPVFLLYFPLWIPVDGRPLGNCLIDLAAWCDAHPAPALAAALALAVLPLPVGAKLFQRCSLASRPLFAKPAA